MKITYKIFNNGGGETSSSSHAVSAPYQQNREITDPALKTLLGNVTNQLSNYFTSSSNGENALTGKASQTLSGIMSGNPNITQTNPYMKQQVANIYNTTARDYQNQLGSARASTAGLGQGTSNLAIGDITNDYLLGRDKQIADLYTAQYNKDVENALNAALGSLAENPTAQIGNLALALLQNFTREYGYQPATETKSSSWQMSI